MIADLRGRFVLIRAAETGLSRALVDAFTAHGASCGRCDSASFASVIAATVANGTRIDALIFGSAPLPPPPDFEQWRSDDFSNAVASNAWPLFDGLQRIKAAQQSYPRYAIGLSPASPNQFAPGADFAAATDAALETLCRFASYRLLNEAVHINVIRHRLGLSEFEAGHTPARLRATCADVARAAVALCSGWMDAMRGQVLTVDRGFAFSNNAMRLYNERAADHPRG